MSLNRRRWSNDLRDSLMHFQNKEDSDSSGSVPMVPPDAAQTYNWSKWRAPSETVDLSLMDEVQPAESVLDVTLEKTGSYEDSFKTSKQYFHPRDENRRLIQNNIPATYGAKVADMDQPILTDILTDLNDRLTQDSMGSSDCGTLKLSSCDSSSYKTADSKSIGSSMETSAKGIESKRYFSSPAEMFQNSEPIADINEPDIWDALISLEQALSPFDGQDNHNPEPQDHTKILNRLSQKFKETPTRFTEKLVLILEDSVISLESPTKQNQNESSGISLNRMTGEFRKLCKFIEDECIENESMPEWAPSLMNTTTFDKMNTSNSTSTALKQIFTPQKNPSSSLNTPVNRFTPSADKSFEYWEKLCDMLERKGSTEQKPRQKSLVPETLAKKSMDEMLTICERQLASLDDSTVELRTSEPCKITDSGMKLKAIQVPRSKSESKAFPSSKDKGHLHDKIRMNAENEEFFIPDDLLKENTNVKRNIELDFDDSFELLNVKSRKPCEKQLSRPKSPSTIGGNENRKSHFQDKNLFPSQQPTMLNYENSYNDVEQDCSLLAELAQRRQRCMDTAKLMMEIDKDSTAYTSSDEDKKCLETLYKLGIQDKTFAEIESDTKFLNTLNQCLEYKNYIRDNNKPIMNMLQKYDSPQDLKKQAVLSMKSKNSITQSKSLKTVPKSLLPGLLQQNSKSKTSLKKVQDRKMTPKFISKPLTVHNPNNNGKLAQTSKCQEKPSLVTTKKTLPEPSKTTLLSASAYQRSNITPQGNREAQRLRKKSDASQHTQKNTCTEKVQNKAERITPKIKAKSDDITSKTTPRISPKPSSTFLSSKTTQKSASKVSLTPETLVDKSPCPGNSQSRNRNLSPRPKFFVSPGKSPKVATLGRKKPSTYFSDVTVKNANNPKTVFESVKSPIGLYINGTDADLIQNVHGRINDRLLTPVSTSECGKSPKLKFNLSSKENKSPVVDCEKDIVLPRVRYQSAKKVHLIDDGSSYSPKSITPNSTTKKLLGPIENTLVIRHQGRLLECSPKGDVADSETSIRFQKMAEKSPAHRKKFVQ